MPKFPDPPGVEALAQIARETETLPAGTTVSRIFFSAGKFPSRWDSFRYFGPVAGRFDHHLPDTSGRPCVQARGIMYLATGEQAIPTCLAEVFQNARLIDRHAGQPVLAGFRLAAPVTLLDLRGPYTTAIGASSALHSGPRPRARRWAQQLYLAHTDIDGLLYCSSMYGNAPVIALFERGASAIPFRPIFHRALNDLALANVLTETAQRIGYSLV